MGINETLYFFQDIFFPSQCVSCGKTVSAGDHNLCFQCENKIERIIDGCTICSGIVENGICTLCSNRKFYITRNISLAEYSGVMKDIITALKFKKLKNITKLLITMAVNVLVQKGLNFDIITAVPMNRTKKWKRGFNQSEVVARGIARAMSIPYRELLKERKGAGTQKNMSYDDRFFNVLERYYIHDFTFLKNKKILIVDDVLTTGATLNECARILLTGGSGEVFSFTLARAE